MIDSSPSSADGVGSIRDWLGRISAAEHLDGLDPKFHRVLRPHAQVLYESGEAFEGEALASVEDSPALSALSAAVYLRSVEATAFWGPLLKHCLTGKSTAPLMDLQTTARQAEVLIRSLSARQPGPVRDEVLRLASEASTLATKWLPKQGSSIPKAGTPARYRRGAFEKKEDEDGNPIVRPPPASEGVGQPPESSGRRVLGWAITLLVLGAMTFVVWSYATKASPELPLSHYQAFSPEVEGKRLQGTELVLTVQPNWSSKPVERRTIELDRLLDAGGRTEQYGAVRIVNREQVTLARIERGSGPQWATVQEPEGAGTGSPALESGEDGMLKRPLRADEIPVD